MSMAHSPGPWHWSRSIDGWELVSSGYFRVLYRREDKAGLRCGIVIGDNLKEADAALIAAAPMLLESLKEMLNAYGRGMSGFSHIDRARDAIAKATNNAQP